jgi:hypothetical protein
VLKDIISLKSLHGIISREDLFMSLCGTMYKPELTWTKLKGVKTVGIPSMTGNKTGLMSRISHNMDKQNP